MASVRQLFAARPQSMKLLAPSPWSAITDAVSRAHVRGRRCAVAIPFVSKGARRLLPLGRGDVLIARVDRGSAKAGVTDPLEIVKFINAGVEVHAVANLHAKVVVAGSVAFVGSANASSSSCAALEAAVCTNDGKVVKASRKFVHGLRGERVTLDFAKGLIAHYRPSKARGSKPPSRGPVVAQHPPLWHLPTYYTEWEAEVVGADAKERPKAARKLEKKAASHLFAVNCDEPRLVEKIAPGDLVVRSESRGRGAVLVQPGHVIHIGKVAPTGGAKRSIVVYIAEPDNARELRRSTFVRRLDKAARHFGADPGAREVIGRAAVREVLQAWQASR